MGIELLKEQVNGLNIALNEAKLLGTEDDWLFPDVELSPVEMDDLGALVRSFEDQPVFSFESITIPYMADFVDSITSPSSFYWNSSLGNGADTFTLTRTDDRILELCAWFDYLEIRDDRGVEIEIEEFIAGSRRYWEGMEGEGDLENWFE